MALKQRSAGHFFAAFYRWNRFTYCPSLSRYTFEPRRNALRVGQCHNSRGFTYTRARLQVGDSAPQVREDKVQSSVLKESSRSNTIQTDAHENEARNQEDLANGHVRETLRTFMRKVAHPVVIITAAASDDSGKAVPVGMCVSSFTTVAMDPPTVSFNIRNPSRTLDAIREDGGRFSAHFLNPTAQAAKIADKFTTGNSPSALEERRRAVHVTLTAEGKPKAAGMKDARVSAFLECKITQEMVVADHVIVAAEVLNVDVKSESLPVMTYVNGQYIDHHGSRLRQHSEAETRSFHWQKEPGSLFWDLPVFIQEFDRFRLRERIRSYIHYNQRLLMLPLLDADAAIRKELSLTGSLLGVRITPILQSEASKAPDIDQQTLGPLDDSLPNFFQFYGLISPKDTDIIIQRAKQLVRDNPLSLQLHFGDFLSCLGVDPRDFSHMTAGDILTALRDDNLAEAYSFSLLEDDHVTLEDVERMERQVVDVMRRKQREQGSSKHVVDSPIVGISKGSRGKRWVRMHMRCVRARLQVEAAPEYYDSNIDISGHLTKGEIRVVIHRIVSWILSSGQLHERLFAHSWAILHTCGIHPLVSGFDAYLFIQRLRYYFNRNSNIKQFRSRVTTRVIDPVFLTRTSLEDLSKNVAELVHTQPIRAVTWDRADLLPMLGLRHNAVLQVSGRHKSVAAQSVLPQLIRSACEARLESFTTEERNLVTKFIDRAEKLERDSLQKITKTFPNPALRMKKFVSSRRERENADVAVGETLNSSDEFEQAMRDLENSGALGKFEEMDLNEVGRSGGLQAYGLDGSKKRRTTVQGGRDLE